MTKIGNRISMRFQRQANQHAKIGETCICPSCGQSFIKNNHQQVFCKTKSGTKCKDYYWNNVDENKRNNTTRISPANQAWMDARERHRSIESIDEDHPFSSEGLGQWID